MKYVLMLLQDQSAGFMLVYDSLEQLREHWPDVPYVCIASHRHGCWRQRGRTKGKLMTCSICDEAIADHRTACSAHPLNQNWCCARCDNLIVTPLRVALSQGINVVALFRQGVEMNRAVVRYKARLQQRKDKQP